MASMSSVSSRGLGHRNLLIILMALFFVFWVVLPTILPGMGYTLNQITAPFRLLGIFVHEMGHGYFSVISGGSFHWFQMNTTSGVAITSGGVHGAVLLGGLLGPAILGSCLLVASTRVANLTFPFGVLLAFFFSGMYYMIKPLFLSRSQYPLMEMWHLSSLIALVVPGAAFGLVLWVMKRSDSLQRVFLQVLGILMCYSGYSDTSYIFRYEPISNGMFSDARVFASLLWPGGPEHVPWLLFMLVASGITALNLGLMGFGVSKALAKPEPSTIKT